MSHTEFSGKLKDSIKICLSALFPGSVSVGIYVSTLHTPHNVNGIGPLVRDKEFMISLG